MSEPTLEQLYDKIESIGKTASDMQKFIASHDIEKTASVKKAEDDKEEKKQAKKAALKKAMEEEDEDKRDAAIRKAMDMEEKDEKKDEKEAQIASIIKEKRDSLTKQILTASRIFNPTQVPEIEARLKTASITEIENEWNIMKPFVARVQPTIPAPVPFIPFYANMTPADIDNNQLTASSPDSAFAKFSTKKLLEGDI